MAKTKISEWSTTPASNTDIDGINIAEGCAPSGINDAIRDLMAQVRSWQSGASGDPFNGPMNGTIGATTAYSGAFTTVSATGVITSTLATGTAPFTIASTTKVTNLNADLLDGADWASPAALGSTTPAAVSATTLSASGTVSGTGFSNYLASPPAIGGTAAAAGSFTTLTTSSTVTLNGGTANGVTYLNGSKVLTSGSALQFDGTNLLVGTTTATYNQANRSSFEVNGSSTSIMALKAGGTGQAYWYYDGAGVDFYALNGSLRFGASGSEQMRLTSTGLGIGTSSIFSKLNIQNSTVRAEFAETSGSNYIESLNNARTSTAGFRIYGSEFKIFTGASGAYGDRLTVDISGNLGLGVTPSAWGSGFKALTVAGQGSSFIALTSSPYTWVGSNWYNDGTNDRYVVSNSAALYRVALGSHAWFTAASGTAGNAISFTQAMSLGADGNLLLGTTSNGLVAARTCIQSTMGEYGTAYQSPSNGGVYYHIVFGQTTTAVGSITSTGGVTLYSTSSDYRLKNITGPITTSGSYIDSLNPVEGTWKADGSTFVGLIAHEVQEASRTQVATGTKDGAEMQAMDYSNSELIANLIAEIQSLRQRVAQLETN
jgi:hypothetical protein